MGPPPPHALYPNLPAPWAVLSLSVTSASFSGVQESQDALWNLMTLVSMTLVNEGAISGPFC